MDNFNNENNGMAPQDMPNTAPAAQLDDDEATDERPAMSGAPQFGQPMGEMPQQSQPVQPMGGMPQQSQPVQPMGGMPQQPQFGQPMGGMNQQPQFGQPMGGMNQQPQFGQPMGMNQQPYGQPPMGGGQPPKAKKPKKPLSKGAIGGIIGGGIALVALIVCAIIFLPKLFPTDKEVVVDAFEATFGVEASADKEDVVGAEEIADKFATTGGIREFSIEVTDETLGETVNVGMVENIDVANKLANSNWVVGMNGQNFINANLVIDETNTYFQLPEMINGYFSLPNENMLQALENSELGQAMGISGMPEFNMTDLYFNLATSNAATELNGEYVAIVEKLWDSITYEKQGKAKIDVNGKTVTAKEYFITVPQDSIKTAVSEIWDAAIAEIAADPATLAEMGMDAATFETTMSSYESMLTSLVQGDLVVKVYIKGDKIVKITSADDISLYGATVAYDMYVDVDDDKASGAFDISAMDESVGIKFNVDSLDSNPSGVISVYAAGETVDVNFKVTDNSSDSKQACDTYFDVVYAGTTVVTGDIKVNADNSANTFDGSMVLDIADAGQISCNFAGGLKDVTKGVAYTMELSKCEVLADGEPMLNMTAKIRIDASKASATGIDTSLPVYDVTTMSETDFEDILALEENTVLLEEWMNAYPDLFGSYEEPEVEEPIEEFPEEETTEDDMILEAENKAVEILGCLDGFIFDYASEWYISYGTEELSYIEYSLNEGYTAEEVATDYIYIPDEDVLAQEIAQTIEVDGETIYYSFVKHNSFGSEYTNYIFARDLGDGVILTVAAGIYDEDEPVAYTKEVLADAISNKYFKIVE